MARVCVYLFVVLCFVPRLGAAEESGTGSSFDDAVAALRSSNVDQVVAAVSELGESGSPAAVDPLVQLLEGGPPDAVTHAALEALGALGHARGVSILVEFVHHRRPAARVIALHEVE